MSSGAEQSLTGKSEPIMCLNRGCLCRIPTEINRSKYLRINFVYFSCLSGGIWVPSFMGYGIFFFLRFYFFFKFGNYLPYPFYFSRVSFTQLWRSIGFPFLSHCNHSTFGSTNLAFSFGLFFPYRFILFRFHIRSPLVQAGIPNI